MVMQRKFWISAILAAGAALLIHSMAIRQAESAHEPDFVASRALDPATGSVLVDLDDDADRSDRFRIRELLTRAIAPFSWRGGVGAQLSEEAQLYRVTPPASELQDVLQMLAADEDVETVELEREWRLPEIAMEPGPLSLSPSASEPEHSRGPYRPNDPHYRYQWHLDQIQMPTAWLQSRGAGVVVAVIDTGVSYRDADGFRIAPDLKQTRFVPGRDLVDDDDTPDDEHGHGTHVAGTIAQSTNNGIGVAGVAPEAAIMPIRVLDARGAGRWGSVAAGIRWAADHGADVINLSLGGAMPSSAISNAIAHAHRKGVVVVAAAGNTGRGRVQYPGADRFAIGVGAVRFDEQLSFYSSYGRHLDVVAPGGDLRVDQNGDGKPDGVLQNTMLRGDPMRHDYLAFQGTSMAAPHVAGLAALIRASGVSDPDAVERILKETAKPKNDKNRYGAGLIQATRALNAATSDLGAMRGLFAGLMVLLAFAGGLRKLTQLEGRGALLGGLVLASGTLALLPWHWVHVSASAFAPVSWLASLPDVAPILLSALPALGAVGIFYGMKRARPWLGGACLGFAALLVVEAIAPTLSFGWLPSMLIGPWLLLNAAVVALIGRQVLRAR